VPAALVAPFESVSESGDKEAGSCEAVAEASRSVEGSPSLAVASSEASPPASELVDGASRVNSLALFVLPWLAAAVSPLLTTDVLATDRDAVSSAESSLPCVAGEFVEMPAEAALSEVETKSSFVLVPGVDESFRSSPESPLSRVASRRVEVSTTEPTDVVSTGTVDVPASVEESIAEEPFGPTVWLPVCVGPFAPEASTPASTAATSSDNAAFSVELKRFALQAYDKLRSNPSEVTGRNDGRV
jgi:hypothetical protein